MQKYYYDKLKFLIPSVVKIEIIKDELSKLYKIEKEIESLIDSNKNGDDDLKIKKMLDDLFCNYKQLFIIMENLNFDKIDNDVKIVYSWAKEERRKLGLSDNLYNIYEGFIPEYYKREEINKNIGNRLML